MKPIKEIRVCCIGGGCFRVANPEKIKWWKDMIDKNKLAHCKITKVKFVD